MFSQPLAEVGFCRFTLSQDAVRLIESEFLRFKKGIRDEFQKRHHEVRELSDIDLWRFLANCCEYKEVTQRGSIFDLSCFHVLSLRRNIEHEVGATGDLTEFLQQGAYKLMNCGFFVSPAQEPEPEHEHGLEPEQTSPPAQAQEPHVDGWNLGPQLWDLAFPNAVTVVTAITESTTENGATEFWPGSHLVSSRTQVLKHTRPITPNLGPGDSVMFSFRTLHRGNVNLTNEDRVLLYLVFHRDHRHHRHHRVKDQNLTALGIKASLLPVETRSGRNKF
jgi:hypothetical protein